MTPLGIEPFCHSARIRLTSSSGNIYIYHFVEDGGVDLVMGRFRLASRKIRVSIPASFAIRFFDSWDMTSRISITEVVRCFERR